MGVVAEEPTVLAVDPKTREPVDVGRSALYLAESSPGRVDLVWPLSNGAVSNGSHARSFLTRLVRPFSGRFTDRTRLVICVPSATTPMERREVRDAAKRAGASHVYLIEQTVAAALGGDLPVHEPIGTLVVVAGAGITEVALLSLGCVVGSVSVRYGSSEIDLSIQQFLRREYGMLVSDRTAEDIKLAVGQMTNLDQQMMIEANGQLVIDGSVVTAILEREEIQPVVDTYIERTTDAVRECMIKASPELAQDLFGRGIFLAGGGAMLGGLAEHLSNTFHISTHVAPDPSRTAIIGAGKCLEAIESLRGLFLGEN